MKPLGGIVEISGSEGVIDEAGYYKRVFTALGGFDGRVFKKLMRQSPGRDRIIAMVIQWGILLVFVLFGGILAQLGAALVQTVISMVLSIAAAVSYVELRQVKEGASIDELAQIFS